MLLEIALNTGSVVLEGAGGVRLPVATERRRAAHSRPHVGPFYGASVYSCSLFVRRSTCGSYRIVSISYRDILSDIVSYLSFSFMAVSCHHYTAVLRLFTYEASGCLVVICFSAFLGAINYDLRKLGLRLG